MAKKATKAVSRSAGGSSENSGEKKFMSAAQVLEVVISVAAEETGSPSISENTQFDTLDIDPKGRRALGKDVKDALVAKGCRFQGLDLSKMTTMKTIGDMSAEFFSHLL